MNPELKLEILSCINKISVMCVTRHGGCLNCEFNEVSASSTARFCMFKKLPALWSEIHLVKEMTEGMKNEH